MPHLSPPSRPLLASLSLRAVLLAALLALLLPGVSAQDPPIPQSSTSTSTSIEGTPTSSPTGPPGVPTAVSGNPSATSSASDDWNTVTATGTPTPGSTAAVGAPTYTLTKPEDTVLVTLGKPRPVVVFEFAYDVSSVALTFNLDANTTGFEAPRVIVSADPDGGAAYYYPNGRNYPDPRSGGTSTGGYNLRRESTYEVLWDAGFANWTYGFTIDEGPQTTGLGAVRPSIMVGLGIDSESLYQPSEVPDVPVDVLIYMTSDFSGEYVSISQLSPLVPVVGDSTGTEAIVFSPVLYADPIPQPTYPNYTLPDPRMVLPEWKTVNGSVALNGTLRGGAGSNFPFGRGTVTTVVMETALSPVALGLGNSFLSLVVKYSLAMKGPNHPVYSVTRGDTTQWMTIAGEQGFRYWALWQDLKPSTNYTLWVIGDHETPIISRPVYFATKSESFRCAIMPPNDLCPGIGYAVPFKRVLADTGAGETQGLVAAVPSSLEDTLTKNLAGFKASLDASGFACGRDMYSFVSTCLDCANAYRDWLCHILLPRCADPSAPAFQDTWGKSAPTKAFSVPRTTDAGRNDANISRYDFDYDEMQPCIGLCTAVERKCPNSLGWVCPHRNFNANESYAYITKDNKKNDGNANTGYPAQDIWGNRWCNMG